MLTKLIFLKSPIVLISYFILSVLLKLNMKMLIILKITTYFLSKNLGSLTIKCEQWEVELKEIGLNDSIHEKLTLDRVHESCIFFFVENYVKTSLSVLPYIRPLLQWGGKGGDAYICIVFCCSECDSENSYVSNIWELIRRQNLRSHPKLQNQNLSILMIS